MKDGNGGVVNIVKECVLICSLYGIMNMPHVKIDKENHI